MTPRGGGGSALAQRLVAAGGPRGGVAPPRFEWHDWLAEQPDEVRALLSTADAWWDNYTAPLAWDDGLEQLRFPPPADAGEWGFFPYLLRGHIGESGEAKPVAGVAAPRRAEAAALCISRHPLRLKHPTAQLLYLKVFRLYR